MAQYVYYIQALELVSKEVAINLLEHLSMLYIQASELVRKEVAQLVSKAKSGNQLVAAPQYVIYSGFSAG